MSHITVNTYKTLHTVARCLAIFPRTDPLGRKMGSNRICVVMNVAVMVTIPAYVAHARYEIFHDRMVATAYYGHVLSNLLIVGTNLWIIINAHVARTTIARILRSFDALSRTVERVNSPRLHRISECFQRSYKVELTAIHVACLFCFAVNFYEWSRFIGYRVAFVDTLKNTLYYHTIVFALVARHFVCLIRYNVIVLKHMLRNISQPANRAKRANCKQHLAFTLGEVQHVFGTVNDIIVTFNKVYGSSIVAFVVNILVNIIVPINMIMLYGNGNRELLGGRFDFFFSFVMFLVTLFPVVLGMALLSTGQQTIDGIKEIPKICYALGQQADIMTKLQLNEFASQVVNLNPQFNASGYFIVNYSVITSVFSTIVTYIIVLIQFNNLN